MKTADSMKTANIRRDYQYGELRRADLATDPFTQFEHWLAAALWRMQGMHDEAANALAYLQKRVPELSAGNLAWMILALREGGLPAADEIVRAALIRLVELRDPAGHWPSDEGAGNAVHVTIEAIKSLQLAGNLS